MNQHEAKFILGSFRPDGADAGSPEFAEALRLAVEDRELGEWLAFERARDAEFARALSEVALPEDLRVAILGSLAAERGDEPERDAFDRVFGEALAGIAPPASLRADILIAMKRSEPRRFGWKLAVPLAAAAGIMLAVAVTRPETPPAGGGGVVNQPPPVAGLVPVSHVEEEAISTLTSPDFDFHLKDDDPEALFRFVRESGRPCPAGCMPRGLRGVRGLGCYELIVDGKPGALLCFLRGEGDVVHLVVFRKEDVACGVEREPVLEQHGKWAVARWSEKGRVLLLMGETDTERLGELF